MGSWSNRKPMQCNSGSPRGSGRQNRNWPPVGVVVMSTTYGLLGSWMACRKSAGERAGRSLMVSIISCSSSPHDQHHPYGFTAQRTAVSNAWPGGGGNGSLLTQAACRRRALSSQAYVCVYPLADAHTHACMRTIRRTHVHLTQAHAHSARCPSGTPAVRGARAMGRYRS